jgi:hypothetical protein
MLGYCGCQATLTSTPSSALATKTSSCLTRAELLVVSWSGRWLQGEHLYPGAIRWRARGIGTTGRARTFRSRQRDGDAGDVHHRLAAVLRVRKGHRNAGLATNRSPRRRSRSSRSWRRSGRHQPWRRPVREGRRQADPVAGRRRPVDPDDLLARVLPGRRQGDGRRRRAADAHALVDAS